MNKKKIFFFRLIIFFYLSFNISLSQNKIQDWIEVAPGVWKSSIGIPENFDLFKAAGINPRIEALNNLNKVKFPLKKDMLSSRITNGQTYLQFPLEKDEEIFGFGLNFKTVNQRGKILQLHVDHYGGVDNGRTHAPVPLYISSMGYGIFVNSARYISVWAGTGVRKNSPNAPKPQDRNRDNNWNPQPYSDAIEMLIPANGVEIYVFGGPTTLDAVRRYNLYCGGGCLPPRWGLGFTQRVPTLFTDEQVKSEVKEFSKHKFPLDFIGLEPGWQSRSYPCTFEWDRTRFPDPAKFVRDMKEMNVRLNLWTNPYVSPESPVYNDILPYSSSHTVWCGVIPDITMPEVKKIMLGQFEKDQISIGVSGYKIDECDGYDFWLWPDVAEFPSGLSAEQIRQTYGVILQKMIADQYRTNNIRTYGLVRASNGGATNLPFVIYNDYYEHKDFITALINSSFCGVLWTPEVRESKTPEEWLRRMQTVCFSPMAMINAWSSGTKPWSFPEVEKQVREMAVLRMQLLPYFYTAFAKYYFEGIPPFRSMNLEEGFSSKTEVKDQYMAGEFLLIAPLFAGETTREVILPKGRWYDFFTGDYIGNGEIVKVTPGLDKIPVFVKDGGIIPFMQEMLHSPKNKQKVDLEIRHYGLKDSKYLLYDDDGESFNYEKGDFSWREIIVRKNNKGNFVGSFSKSEKDKPDNIGKISWKFMSIR